ncbi:MAG: hypothetical protein V3W19_07150 [Desulfatiglandales bacterium]
MPFEPINPETTPNPEDESGTGAGTGDGSQVTPVEESWDKDHRYEGMTPEQALKEVYKSEREAEKTLGSMKDELGQLREKTDTTKILQSLENIAKQNQQVTQQDTQPKIPQFSDEQKEQFREDPTLMMPVFNETLQNFGQALLQSNNKNLILTDLQGRFGARYAGYRGNIDKVIGANPGLLAIDPSVASVTIQQQVLGEEAMNAMSGQTAPHTPVPAVTAGATATVTPPANTGELNQDEAALAKKFGFTPEQIKKGREMKKKQDEWSPN